MEYSKPVRRNVLTAAVLVGIVIGVPFSIYWVRSHAPQPVMQEEIPTDGQG